MWWKVMEEVLNASITSDQINLPTAAVSWNMLAMAKSLSGLYSLSWSSIQSPSFHPPGPTQPQLPRHAPCQSVLRSSPQCGWGRAEGPAETEQICLGVSSPWYTTIIHPYQQHQRQQRQRQQHQQQGQDQQQRTTATNPDHRWPQSQPSKCSTVPANVAHIWPYHGPWG